MAHKLTPAQIQQAEKNAAAEGFLHRVAVAADQDLNVDSGGLPDETISSRIRRVCNAHPRWSWNPGIWFAKTINAALDLLQNGHGQRAQCGDLERALKVAATESWSLGISVSPTGNLVAKEHVVGVPDLHPQISAANRTDAGNPDGGGTPASGHTDRSEESLVHAADEGTLEPNGTPSGFGL